ncbi:MAG TPA: hypothetical protein VLB82_07720 [Thermodesulfobacteriota bacterium]|nr:hypothetical protein [Thermodesulfobacteriota bacterium]
MTDANKRIELLKKYLDTADENIAAAKAVVKQLKDDKKKYQEELAELELKSRPINEEST